VLASLADLTLDEIVARLASARAPGESAPASR
jgi:hypothetical protein